MKNFYIIDTYGLIFRAFYALQDLKTSTGQPIGAVYGFLKTILSIFNENKPDYILFALDSGGETFRDRIYNNFFLEQAKKLGLEIKEIETTEEYRSLYKANRKETPMELRSQFSIIFELLEILGMKIIGIRDYEADDIIASYAQKANKNQDIKITIISSDKDLFQLIDERISIFDPMKKKIIDKNGCFEKFGVFPEQMLDYLSIIGDASDNIPGIRGLGPKAAISLLKDFKNVDEILKNKEKIQNSKYKELINKFKDFLILSRDLVKLEKNLEVIDFENLLFNFNNDNLIKFIEKYEFKNLIIK